ncbi:LamG domain-containing protein [Mycolicibacterium palauense]|uniref:hypothetical protein n=1 Tax=Mycolicibacterium palauense TaxID=2034511 RepID=UPI001FEA7944|nr:hypothetical protein [Mycolicibacterium palauense]
MSDYGATSIDEDFGNGLDENVWLPAYLPAWSSRAAAAADWSVSERGLVLRIGAGHPLWCPQDHQPPLRVSAVQSANWSGPVGSTLGQQPFRPGQRVREAQPEMWGLTPLYGTVEVTCRADIDEASMFSAWMIGLEDLPSRCGEICLVEVFGSTVRSGPGAPRPPSAGASTRSGIRPWPRISRPRSCRSTRPDCTAMPWTGRHNRCDSASTENRHTFPPRHPPTRCS